MTLASLGKPAIHDDDILSALVRDEDIGSLVQGLFGYDLSPGQERIARTVAFPKGRERVTIMGPTRYGKSRSWSLGLATRIIIDPKPMRIKVIGPLEEQALIQRRYMAEAIVKQPLLGDMVDKRGGSGVESLKKEVSHKRITFQDGKEFATMTAQGDADRLMGEGGDIVAKDESCLISAEAEGKISRMLGDSPDAELYELANPWHRENAFFKHTLDKGFDNIAITMEQAIAEGRLDTRLVEEQRRDLPPTTFQVLYMSQFPDIAEDQLIPWTWATRSIRTGQAPFKPPENDTTWRLQYGADIAEGGLDKTVLTRGWKQEATKRLIAHGWRSWQVADTMVTAKNIRAEVPDNVTVGIDENGVGKGVADRLREFGAHVYGFKGGRQARNPERFANATSEALWLLRRGFEEGVVELHDPPQALLTDLSKWRWTVVAGRTKVEVEGGKEGGNSPDFGDSLAILYYASAGGQQIRKVRGKDPLGLR